MQCSTSNIQHLAMLKILLIEDNIGDVYLVKALLMQSDFAGSEILNCVTLKEGLEALAQQEFTIVLLDLSLPDSLGFDTLHQLISNFPETTVIVMTGLGDREIGLRAVKAGAQDFLVKGKFDADLLAKTLHFAVERKKVLITLGLAQKAREVAEASAALKEQFIANISHEMRTPMNAIYGMSHLLAKTPLNAEQNGYIDSIKQSSEILLGVINDVLDISTLQNGKMTFEEKAFDLPELLNNVLNLMHYKREEKDLEFHMSVADSVPRIIIGDKLRLNQILFNIVGNAVKFTDKGFVKISVEAVNNPVGKLSMKFDVQDSGIGIPDDKINTIFDSFTRIRTKDRLFEGTGLGLSIVKNLVELQNGSLSASSKLGVGTRVTVIIPFKISNSLSVSDFDNPKSGEIRSQKLSEKYFRLLLVEDHKVNQLVARKTLEKQFNKIEIVIAENGKICIDLIESGEVFDIIIMDIQMPVMDGTETTAYIRKNMPYFKTPILAMSAHGFMSKRDVYEAQGFDNFILKPFKPEELFETIEQYVFAVPNYSVLL